MTDLIIRADTQAVMDAAFQVLGAWDSVNNKPITQGITSDGQQWFCVFAGGGNGVVMVPERNPAGWTSTTVNNAMGQPVTTWKPNGPVVTQTVNGVTSTVMQAYDTGFWAMIRWLGANPPQFPTGIVAMTGLNPDVMAGLTVIA